MRAPELFWRQLSFADFDVSEMSMSSLMMSVAAGDDRWMDGAAGLHHAAHVSCRCAAA